ncbi:MAG: flagellar biosynthesis protein FlgB [Armatimonadetes bacterium]|nr:flagellar biosynthesis protein FlgB [Armatimonadota bacterium]
MIQRMEQALDALSRRQKVVANNLANVNTPEFTRRDVDFFSYMSGLYEDRDLPLEVKDDAVTPPRADGNNVTLEREMFALTQTEMLYQTVSRFTTDRIKGISYAITEGRG